MTSVYNTLSFCDNALQVWTYIIDKRLVIQQEQADAVPPTDSLCPEPAGKHEENCFGVARVDSRKSW